MHRRLAAAPVLLLFAGCLQPTTPVTPWTPNPDEPDGVVTHAPASGADPDIVLDGTVARGHGLFLANVTAHNTGWSSYRWSRPYCRGTPWTAVMAGSSGEGVDYLGPRDPLGCPGASGTFSRGDWINWTADPSCRIASVCDNWWDGRLWDGDRARPAPPGNYTWIFTFHYHRTLADAGGTGTSMEVPASAGLSFRLHVE